MRPIARVLWSVCLAALTVSTASAQSVGTFRWQLQPFCNLITVHVTYAEGVYRLEGADDQCGAMTVAPVIGIAAINPSGSITLGLTHVTTPGGVPVHVDAVVTLPGASGTWRDSAGRGGSFVLTPGVGIGGSPRPTSGLGSAAVNPTEVQLRIGGSCAAGAAVRAINQDGTVTCEPVAGGSGDITSIVPGPGLVGGAASGDAALAVAFGGSGAETSVARSDHTHQRGAANSVAIGPSANPSGTGILNTVVGSGALQSGTSADQNTAIGARAMQLTTTGTGNVVLGGDALRMNTTGSFSTALGYAALQSATVGSLTAVGSAALFSNTTGCCNSGLGVEALAFNQVGSENTAVGYQALKASTSSFNTAVGAAAAAATTGLANTAVGAQALYANTSGSNNAAFGDSAIRSIVAGSDHNAAFGHHAGDALTAGSENVFVGSMSGDSLATGARNVLVGAASGVSLTTGNDNIMIGRRAGLGTTSGSNNVFLGAQGGAGAESDTLRIGTTQTRAFIAGIHAQTSSSGIPVFINLLGQLGTTTSSRRFKENIVPLAQARHVVQSLQPVQFTYKPAYDDGAQQVQYGLIAEDVEGVDPNLVVTLDGQVQTVRYHFLPPLLVAEVQRLEQARAALEDTLRTQDRELQAVRDELAALKAMLTATATKAR